MAIIKMLNATGKYSDPFAIKDVLSYICLPYKTPSQIVGGIHIDFQNVVQSMEDVSCYFGKNSGVRLRHFVLSFLPAEIHFPSIPLIIADQICRYLGQEYQVVYAFHEDTKYPHIHFVFNTVSYLDGHKYRGNKQEYYALLLYIKNSRIFHSAAR